MEEDERLFFRAAVLTALEFLAYRLVTCFFEEFVVESDIDIPTTDMLVRIFRQE